jgi:hypothetical protein
MPKGGREDDERQMKRVAAAETERVIKKDREIKPDTDTKTRER